MPAKSSPSPPDTPSPAQQQPAQQHLAADALIPTRYVGDSLVYLARHASGGRRFAHADGAPLEPKRVSVQVPPGQAAPRGRDGKPRTVTQTVYALSPGDTLMMPAGEVLGVTFLHPYNADGDPDANNGRPSYLLGAGWCPLPEHGDLDWSPDLRLQPFLPQSGPQAAREGLYVYDYHEGRHDFAPLPPYDDPARLPGYLRELMAAAPAPAPAPAQDDASSPAPVPSSETDAAAPSVAAE